MTGEQIVVAYAVIAIPTACWLFVLLLEAADRDETKRKDVVMAALALVWPLLLLGLLIVALIVAAKQAVRTVREA